MSYLLMKGIDKSFPGVRALKSIDFEAKKGEIHAIAGENGAGKSTLIKVLSGAYQPDRGQIYIDGKQIEINDPFSGRNQGISVIYQELSLVPYMTIAENIFLANMPSRFGTVQRSQMNKLAKEALEDIGFELNPSSLIKDLSIVQQQAVEIAKILVEKTKIVVMDEPTALLPAREVETLFRVMNNLREQGITVLYISHRLSEIFKMADRVTVLKDGSKVGTVRPSDITQDELVTMMIGRKPSDRIYWSPERVEKLKNAPVVLKVEGLVGEKNLHEVSFALRQGEVLGVAGLVGSGKSELAQYIFGAKQPKSGVIKIYEKEIKRISPRMSIRNKVGFLPADRKNQGLFMKMTIRKNATLTALPQFSKWGIVNQNKEEEAVSKQIGKLKIKCYDQNQEVNTLSGGNQQKVVMAKWLLSECKVLIFDEPTRGIDVGARSEIYELIIDYAHQGAVIIIVSSDTQELLAISDRIIVMGEGKVTASFSREEATEDKIVRAMF